MQKGFFLLSLLLSFCLAFPAAAEEPVRKLVRQSAYFLVKFDNPTVKSKAKTSKSSFVIMLENPDQIAQARALLAGNAKDRRAVHINGTVVKGKKDYNPGWNFYLKPYSIGFFEVEREYCDASPETVQANIDDWVSGSLKGYWCPWQSYIAEELAVRH